MSIVKDRLHVQEPTLKLPGEEQDAQIAAVALANLSSTSCSTAKLAMRPAKRNKFPAELTRLRNAASKCDGPGEVFVPSPPAKLQSSSVVSLMHEQMEPRSSKIWANETLFNFLELSSSVKPLSLLQAKMQVQEEPLGFRREFAYAEGGCRRVQAHEQNVLILHSETESPLSLCSEDSIDSLPSDDDPFEQARKPGMVIEVNGDFQSLPQYVSSGCAVDRSDPEKNTFEIPRSSSNETTACNSGNADFGSITMWKPIQASSSLLAPLVVSSDGTASICQKRKATLSPNAGRKVAKHCEFVGCNKNARSGGTLCRAHGGGKRCSHPGCIKSDQGKGFCKSHGGGKSCGVPACSKSDQGGGFCKMHGGGKRCSVVGCIKSDQGKGFCTAHGGGKRCGNLKCNKSAAAGGFCTAHGGGKRCEAPGCLKHDKGGGFCVGHGGGKRCKHPECSKIAQCRGFCISHDSNMCKQDECNKHAQTGGYCIKHGGGKRCETPGCSKLAKAGSFCIAHGGGKRCGAPGCLKHERSGGKFCVLHGGGKRCLEPGCTKGAKLRGMCKSHAHDQNSTGLNTEH